MWPLLRRDTAILTVSAHKATRGSQSELKWSGLLGSHTAGAMIEPGADVPDKKGTCLHMEGTHPQEEGTCLTRRAAADMCEEPSGM